MSEATKRARSLIAESRENRNPVWVSHTPGLLVALVERSCVTKEADGVYRVEGEDWTVCVVS